MPDPQTATAHFFGPVAVAYVAACLSWVAYDRMRRLSSDERPLELSDRPRLDLILALVAAAAILLLGAVHRQGWLLPVDESWIGRAFWIIDNAIIYSPIAMVLFARRQDPMTVFLSRHRLAEKISLGLGLGVAAVSIYFALRGDAPQVGTCLASALEPEKLVSFPAIFLEGVAVAFAYVRLRWLLGTPAAMAVPCALFAIAHIPGQIAEHREVWEITAFFLFNSALVAVILGTVQRSRDMTWIGIVHYFMDIAIRAI